MKKTLIIFVISILLIGLPAATAKATISQRFNTVDTFMPKVSTTTLDNDTPPDWAAGNFSGEWGITLFGIPAPASGWIKGYFSDRPGWGAIEGGYAVFNETNATNILSGFMIWIFFLGGVRNVASGNGTWVSGIGVANETHFYWRLNAIIGPSYYIHCEYSKFEE